MSTREAAKSELDTMDEALVERVYDFILFEKYRRIYEMDDSTYLASIPGMMESIDTAIAAPRSERIPLEEVWPDV